MLTRASALSLATPKCSFEPEMEMISTSHQGVKSPKKGAQETSNAPEWEHVGMDNSEPEAYHPVLGRGRVDPSTR